MTSSPTSSHQSFGPTSARARSGRNTTSRSTTRATRATRATNASGGSDRAAAAPAWLVLSEPGDGDARWAHAGLARRGLAPIELVTTDELLAASRWEHRLGPDAVTVSLELADGRVVHGDGLRGVLNRLVAVRPTSLHRAAAADREYASQELYAFWLSWLAALPGRVLNRPSPHGLSGPWLERTEWLMLAARAGLPTPAYQGGSRPALSGPARRIIVVGRKALGPAAPREVVAGCGRLARFARTAILGVDFDRAWLFAGATSLPGLRRGGEPMLDLLAAALRRAA